MVYPLTAQDLRKYIQDFKEAQDPEKRKELFERANKHMNNYALRDAALIPEEDKRMDVALEAMLDFIQTFGIVYDEEGKPVLNEKGEPTLTVEGARAMGTLESAMESLMEMERNKPTPFRRDIYNDGKPRQDSRQTQAEDAEIVENPIQPAIAPSPIQPAIAPSPEQPAILPNPDQQYAEDEAKNRIYSMTSDQNQIMFDRVSLGVFQGMGLVDDKLNPNDMTPAQVAEVIDKTKLNDEQRLEYAARFVDALVSDQSKFELIPPRILADAYVATKNSIQGAKTDVDRETYMKRFATLASRIDDLIVNFDHQTENWYTDPTNIMDVHDGYTHMMDVRQQDLGTYEGQNEKTKKYNQELNAIIDRSRQTLSGMLEEYDALYKLTKVNPEHADELMERWKDLKQRLGQVSLTPETMETLAKYKFLDENGQPIPQFLNEKGEKSLEYKEGYKLDPKGRLAQVINLARNDVTMENVGDLDTPVADMDLEQMLNAEVPWTLSEISIPDQVRNGIIQDPNKKLDEAQVQGFWDSIKVDGGEISDQGYQDGLDAHANKAAGFATRMSQKLQSGEKPIVHAPLHDIEDIDRLATTRSEKEGAAGRKQKLGLVKRMLKNFGMGFAVSAGLTFLGKATGIAWIGAAIGTTIGIGNMIYQGMKWRNEQKRLGKPHGLMDFFKDKRNWGPALATGLGTAATICMATGNPELGMAFGLGAMTAGVGTGVVTTYKDAIRAGYTPGQALAGAIGVGASGALGAFAGNYAMNSLVNYVNNNTDSTLFKHGEERLTTRQEFQESTQREYEPGVIENNERILKMWEDPATLDARIDGLMADGLSRDDAVRYLMAFHDATDHNLGPGYFDSIGMSPEQVAALRNSINGTEVNLTPESIAAFEHFNPHISATNTVGYIPGAPTLDNLPANATYGPNGELIPGNDLYSTYVNHDTPIFHDTIVQTPVTITDYSTIFTPNELAYPGGLGMFGIYEPRVLPAEYVERLKTRIGGLSDRIVPMDRVRPRPPLPPHVEEEEEQQEQQVLPPHVEEEEEQEQQEQQVLPPHVEEEQQQEQQEQQVLPPHVEEEEQQQEQQEQQVLPPHVEEEEQQEQQEQQVLPPHVEEEEQQQEQQEQQVLPPHVEEEQQQQEQPEEPKEPKEPKKPKKPKEPKEPKEPKPRPRRKKPDVQQNNDAEIVGDDNIVDQENVNIGGDGNVGQKNKAKVKGNKNKVRQKNKNQGKTTRRKSTKTNTQGDKNTKNGNVAQENKVNIQGNNNKVIQINNNGGMVTIEEHYHLPDELIQRLSDGTVQQAQQYGYTVNVDMPVWGTSVTQDANIADQPQVETPQAENPQEEKPQVEAPQEEKPKKDKTKADKFKTGIEKVEELGDLQAYAMRKMNMARKFGKKSIWAKAVNDIQKLQENQKLTEEQKKQMAQQVIDMALKDTGQTA